MHPSLVLLAIGVLPLVAGHCKITSAKGDLGGKGTALGITDNDGNSQSDVTVFSGGKAKPFGDTPGGGDIDPATALPASMALAGNTLPQVSTGGTVTMNLHQINSDGAGPMKCSVDSTASGDNFKDMTITTNVPGQNGRSNAANADFPLVAKMPDGVSCSGTVAGVKNVCLVKCQNPSGPFGGTVAVQTGGAGAADSGTDSTADSGADTGSGSGTAGNKNGTETGTGAATGAAKGSDGADSGTNSTADSGADAGSGSGTAGNKNGTETGAGATTGAAKGSDGTKEVKGDRGHKKGGHKKGHKKGDQDGKTDKGGNEDGKTDKGGNEDGKTNKGGNEDGKTDKGGNEDGKTNKGGNEDGKTDKGGNEDGKTDKGGNEDGKKDKAGNAVRARALLF